MNLANWITVTRIFVTVAVFVCLEIMRDPTRPDAALVWWAFGLFVFAAATDAADGWVARRYGIVTRLGRIIDPFADKVLICGTMISLLRFPVVTEIMQSWMVVLVVARELLVTTVRGLAEASGVAFPAEKSGKLKMVAQCIAVGALLSLLAGVDSVREVAVVSIWVTIVLTVVSGTSYMVRARKLLTS